jgi:hypothetical protein
MRNSQVLLRRVGLALVCLLSGCTYPMWEAANRTEVSGPRIARFDVTGAGTPAGRVVVSYSVEETSREALFTLPLEGRAGTAEAATDVFRYRGEKRTPAKIFDDLTTQRREAVRSARLAPAGMRDRPHEGSADANRLPAARGPWVSTPTYYPDGDRGGIAVVALAPSGAERTWEDQCMDPGGRRSTFPPGSVVLLLPNMQPRPAGDRAVAQMVAAAATPVTMAADFAGMAVVMSILLPAYWLGLAPKC